MCKHCNVNDRHSWKEQCFDGEMYESHIAIVDNIWVIATLTPTADWEYSCRIEFCPKCGNKLPDLF